MSTLTEFYGFDPRATCPWCGLRGSLDNDGLVVLAGLWRPVHAGECEQRVNDFLKDGHPHPPHYGPVR